MRVGFTLPQFGPLAHEAGEIARFARTTPMGERGARLDEALDALEVLWTADPAEYHGRHWTVPATHANLKPVRRPRPPVYLAGFSPAAVDRIARRADGWLPVIAPGARPVDPAKQVAAPMAHIRELAGKHGRDPAELGLVLRVNPAGDRTVEAVADAIVLARDEAGVDNAFVDLMYLATDVAHALELAAGILELTRAR